MSVSLIGKNGTAIATVANAVPVYTGDAGTPASVGAVKMFSENDAGAQTGTAYLKSPETSTDYRLRVGLDTLLLTDTFSASTQNTNLWSYTFSTLTAAQPGTGTVNFGTVQGTTNGHGAFMRTYQYFPVMGTAPLAVEFTAGMFSAKLVANEVWAMGLGLPGGAATLPTDGVWVQCTSAGYVGVLRYNNVDTQTGVLWPDVNIVLNDLHKWVIVVGETEVEFWRNDELLGEITIPAGNGQPFQQATLPVFMMKFCTGAVASTNTVRVSDITVSLMDVASNKNWQHQLSIAGQSGRVGQNGHTQGRTALWANNTAPTAIALTNTAVGFTGLGGIAAFLPTLTASNDGILFGYQNPAGTINLPGRNLIITGVRLDSSISVILAGGPLILCYALAYGHLAASLASTETASFANNTTHSPRIHPLGVQCYATNAPVASIAEAIDCSFDSPIVVRPGEFVQIIVRNAGVVTTTGAVTVVAGVDSYWE